MFYVTFTVQTRGRKQEREKGDVFIQITSDRAVFIGWYGIERQMANDKEQKLCINCCADKVKREGATVLIHNKYHKQNKRGDASFYNVGLKCNKNKGTEWEGPVPLIISTLELITRTATNNNNNIDGNTQHRGQWE